VFTLSGQRETPPLGGGGGAVVDGNLNVSRRIFFIVEDSTQSNRFFLDFFAARISESMSQSSSPLLGLRSPDLLRRVGGVRRGGVSSGGRGEGGEEVLVALGGSERGGGSGGGSGGGRGSSELYQIRLTLERQSAERRKRGEEKERGEMRERRYKQSAISYILIQNSGNTSACILIE
jgi:hypothetical protein